MPRFHHRAAFQPKANVPMATESRDRLALELRMAGESLIVCPSIDAYNTLSKMLAALNRAGLRDQNGGRVSMTVYLAGSKEGIDSSEIRIKPAAQEGNT